MGAAPLIILLIYGVVLVGRDFWPFTSYPMFSRYADPDKVAVTGFLLETGEGQLIWWRPRFYRYPETIGLAAAQGDVASAIHAVSEVLRLVRLEDPHSPTLAAVHLVQRSWTGDGIEDQSLARFPLSDGARGL